MGFKDWDLYRRIPRELTEASTHGWFLSIIASVCIVILVVAETSSFLAADVISDAVIDSNTDHALRIALNISLPQIPCEYASVNVVDVLGTRDFNVSTNMRRFALDADGRQLRRMVDISPVRLGSNIKIETHHPSLEELHANGEHATLVEGTEHFDAWLADHPLVFVDFYAPWCTWCQKLAPAYEVLAERVYEEQLDVSVIRVDCEASRDLCIRERVLAFPLLRLYRNSIFDAPDYSLDRTVESMMTYLKSKVFLTDEEPTAPSKANFLKNARSRKRDVTARLSSSSAEEVGCMLQGYLNVNRVPGHFYLEARSRNHDINPTMANMTHVIHHLSFGPPSWTSLTKYGGSTGYMSTWIEPAYIQARESVPEAFYSDATVNPLDGGDFKAMELHQSYHHFIKVVSTHLSSESHLGEIERKMLAYQLVASSKLRYYDEDEAPKAIFTFDLSPMAIEITVRRSKPWYDFIISLCAIVGGSFVCFSLLSSFITATFTKKRD